MGCILGCQLKSSCKRPRVLIGRDTRISGEMLESALMTGLISSGVDMLKLGVIPPPGVSYLTEKLDVQAGIMISASHNPVQDNGIKIFSHSGYKLSDAEDYHLSAKEYVDYLETTISHSLKGLKVVLDCANGASSALAPKLFKDLGAEVISIFQQLDGININESCGSTHPEKLAEAVVEYKDGRSKNRKIM